MDPDNSDLTIADVVASTAGHDEGCLFYVLGTDSEYLLLADGKNRTLEHPKRKNPKHLHTAFSGEFDHPVIRKLQEGTPVTNRELRKALAAFKEGITLG